MSIWLQSHRGDVVCQNKHGQRATNTCITHDHGKGIEYMNNAVIYEQENNIVRLTLNEPDSRNAISQTMVEELVNVCERISRDASVRCVILTGKGKSFSAGGNVKDMRERKGMFADRSVPAQRQDYLYGIQRIPLALYNLEVPTIAAVNGHAIGAGCDLSLMCDIRVASENAVFGESFVRLGLISGDGGAWFLQRTIGRSRAYELTLTGDIIDAKTAFEYGLVSRVVADDELMDATEQVARRIAVHPPHTLRLNKRLLRESEQASLEQSLNLAASFQAIAQQTQDHHEAVDAFFEKRAPEFSGN